MVNFRSRFASQMQNPPARGPFAAPTSNITGKAKARRLLCPPDAAMARKVIACFREFERHFFDQLSLDCADEFNACPNCQLSIVPAGSKRKKLWSVYRPLLFRRSASPTPGRQIDGASAVMRVS
jgi:hypothetical protein